MKLRTCFVSNSSSSSFVISDANAAEARARIVECCTSFVLAKLPPKRRTKEKAQEIRASVKRFVSNPNLVQIVEFPEGLSKSQRTARMKLVENLTYARVDDIAKMLDERVRPGSYTATVVSDAENAFIEAFEYAPTGLNGEEESIMSALERSLGTYPERMT